MKAVTIKCRALMVGDWCCDLHGFPMQITNVGEDYAYATWEGNEGDPWEYDDKDEQLQPIPLTPEILEKNGWHFSVVTKVPTGEDGYWVYEEGGIELLLHFPIRPFAGVLRIFNKAGVLRIFDKWLIRRMPDFMWKDTLYVHELQHALRLCGLNELADNFKV